MDPFIKRFLTLVDPWCDYIKMQTSAYEAPDPHDAVLLGFSPQFSGDKSVLAIKRMAPGAGPWSNRISPDAAVIQTGPTESPEVLAIGALANDIRRDFILPSFAAQSFAE